MADPGEVKYLTCPKCAGPFADLRGVAVNVDQFRREDWRCFQFDQTTIECREDGETILRSYITPTVLPPLHAQVAEALGWTTLQDRGDGLWIGVQPETGLTVEVPPYGRSWCSTGPLVDRFMVGVEQTLPYFVKRFGTPAWSAWVETHIDEDGTPQKVRQEASTPCEAIARVVVELHRSRIRLTTAVAEQHAEALRNPQPVTENYAAQSRKKDK